MKILMSAYQCGPGMGSVSQIGWEWYSRISRRAQVTLVTHVRNRGALAKAGAPLPQSEILYIDTEWFAGPVFKAASRLFPRSEHAVFLLSSADFFLYDWAALKRLKEHTGGWSIAHAVTPVSPLASTRLHELGVPLILGPWNGGLNSPTTFPEIMSQDSAWLYRIRAIGRVFDRFFHCTKNAALVLSANRATDASLPAHAKTRRMIENGVDLDLFHPGEYDLPAPPDPLRVLVVGRLIPAKGISMLLEAVSRIRAEFPVQVTIAGDGPLRAALEHEVLERQLSHIVRFTGALPLPEIAKEMRNAHVFCLPSVRESGGAVLLESLASGVPILAVNYGGPGEIVDDEVGRTLSADGPAPLIRDLIDALRDIVRNPEQWKLRSNRARARAERQYGWDARVEAALGIYQQMTGARAAHG
jgi:glycosyltransferase involved in cell wall biosynthesis